MAIIGRLLKKTTEITYHRHFVLAKEFGIQLDTLEALLYKARDTNFGQQYEFENIIDEHHNELVVHYQQRVPIRDYEAFYKSWLKQTIDGAKDHTWPGKINYFALSSGTTGSPSKRIPVSRSTIRSFQRTSVKQISTLYGLNLSKEVYNSSVLAVGGSSDLTQVENHFEGDLSGILKKHTSIVAAPFTKPENNIAKIKDWSVKLEKMIEKAPSWNIGLIAGVPSWCLLLMENIIERYQLKTIHDIWPNLEVYVHGGVFLEPYLPRLEAVFGKKVHYLDTYLSSEGYFAYQTSVDSPGMQLLLNNGIFFEFVPFNETYFDGRGELINQHKALTLNEVEDNVDYALIISTNSGLWRYMIGDLVRFISVENRIIKITGRIKQYLSHSGEHLSLDNINNALTNTAKFLQITVSEFCICTDEEENCHNWYIGTNDNFDEIQFQSNIDQELSMSNDDYKSCRKFNLNKPHIIRIPVEHFYKFMESIGKAGSQNKFPRVMNKTQAEKWNAYLKLNELI